MPWIVVPLKGINDPLWVPKEAFFDIICLGAIVLSFKDGLNFKYQNKYLMWFTGWVFLTVIFNWYFPFVFSFNQRQLLNIWIIFPYIHFILALFTTYIVCSTLQAIDFIKIAKAICLTSMCVSVYALLEVIGLEPAGKIFKFYHGNHLVALLGQPNVMGNYMAIVLPFYFCFKETKYKLGFLLALVCVILSKSHIAQFCAFFGLILYLFLKYRHNKKITALILIIFLIASIFGGMVFKDRLERDGLSQRVLCWKESFNRFKDNPFFGQGIGIYKTFEIMPVEANQVKWFFAHSDWFERAIELGLFGAFLLVLIVLNSLKGFNYSKDNLIGFSYYSSFVVFLLLMLFSFPVEIAPLCLLGLVNFWAVEKF